MMKVTSTNYRPQGDDEAEIWLGTAIDGLDRLEWFYQPGVSFDLRREQQTGMWFPLESPPPGAWRAVLSAIKAN